MNRWFAAGLLLALSACHRSGVADVTLDADAAQRNATASKTLTDLAAATAASQGPAPVVGDREPSAAPANTARRIARPEPDTNTTEAGASDETNVTLGE